MAKQFKIKKDKVFEPSVQTVPKWDNNTETPRTQSGSAYPGQFLKSVSQNGTVLAK
jgi:hypothetical protein